MSICYRDASTEVLFNLSNRHADTVAKAKRTLLSVSCADPYLERGGDINIAKRMAGHSNVKTTELYGRRGDEVSFSEIERVGI